MSTIADTKVARRYAHALFGTAQKLQRMQEVQRDLDSLVSLLENTPALRQLMDSPLIAPKRKKTLITELFGRDFDPLTLSFLGLLVDKRREEIIPSVREQFRLRLDEALNLVRARAAVAAPLDDAQRASLEASLTQRTGKRVELTVEVNPELIGGVVVRMNDTVIDGSVRGALERLREQMLQER